ncbi:MAG: hypothetical protein ACUVV0_17295 [Anaerolineae bacterium]
MLKNIYQKVSILLLASFLLLATLTTATASPRHNRKGERKFIR